MLRLPVPCDIRPGGFIVTQPESDRRAVPNLRAHRGVASRTRTCALLARRSRLAQIEPRRDHARRRPAEEASVQCSTCAPPVPTKSPPRAVAWPIATGVAARQRSRQRDQFDRLCEPRRKTTQEESYRRGPLFGAPSPCAPCDIRPDGFIVPQPERDRRARCQTSGRMARRTYAPVPANMAERNLERRDQLVGQVRRVVGLEGTTGVPAQQRGHPRADSSADHPRTIVTSSRRSASRSGSRPARPTRWRSDRG